MLFETSRMLIRPVRQDDFDFIYQLQSDPLVMHFIRPAATEPKSVMQRVELWLDYAAHNPGLGVFIMEMKHKGQLLGYCTGRHVDFNPENAEYELGYVIAPEYGGRGLATEVTAGLLQYLAEMEKSPIVAFTHPSNFASQQVLLKNNFRPNGKKFVYDGESLEFVWP